MAEIISLRTRYSKTFDLGGGVRQEVVGPVPIHYTDVNGAYQEIDSNLKASSGGYDWENTANDFSARFKANLNDVAPIMFARGGVTVSFRPRGIALFDRVLNAYTIIAHPNNTAPTVSDREILFPNLYPTVDAAYQIGPTGIKEFIRVKAGANVPAPSAYGYDPATTYLVMATEITITGADSYQDELGALTQTRDLGKIAFIKGGVAQFSIPELLGWEGNGTVKNVLKKRLKIVGGKPYLLHGIEYAKYAAATKFPYVLDTTVQYDTGSGSWACPSGVTSVQIECWGGGGYGGSSGGSHGSGGGGGGAYAKKNALTVSYPNSCAYQVGFIGGTSWFKDGVGTKVCEAVGGGDGEDQGPGGQGGQTSGCTGDVKTAGSNGASPSDQAGGTGGTGGNGGNGGGGGEFDQPGGDGTQPGGGGGGAGGNDGSDPSGGAGASGRILLTYASGGTNYTLPASGGSFAETGAVVGLKAGRRVTAVSGGYDETGTAVSLKCGRKVAAAAGSYAESGTAVLLKYGRLLASGGGLFSLAGTDAGLSAGRKVAAGSGTYSFTGQAVTLICTQVGAYLLTAGGGECRLTGRDVALRAARLIAAGSGSIAETGAGVTLRKDSRLGAGAGSYAFTGFDVAFIHAATGDSLLPADPGVFILTGYPASMVKFGILPGRGYRSTGPRTGHISN